MGHNFWALFDLKTDMPRCDLIIKGKFGLFVQKVSSTFRKRLSFGTYQKGNDDINDGIKEVNLMG